MFESKGDHNGGSRSQVLIKVPVVNGQLVRTIDLHDVIVVRFVDCSPGMSIRFSNLIDGKDRSGRCCMGFFLV